MLDELLAEVQALAARRNREVSAGLVHFLARPPRRSCGHQQALVKMREFVSAPPSLAADEFAWRRHRSLSKKLSFTAPCGWCDACIHSM